MSQNLKARRELADVLRRLEGDASKLNQELKSLKAAQLSSSTVVTVNVSGLESSDSLSVLLLPSAAVSGGDESEKASTLELTPATAQGTFTVSTSEGLSLKASTGDIDLGSWPLALASPVAVDLCLDPSGTVQRLSTLSAEISPPQEDIEGLIREKEDALEALAADRRRVKAEMQALQAAAVQESESAAAAATSAQGQVGGGSAPPGKKKASVWSKMLAAPLAVANLATFVATSPLKEILFFGSGVLLLKYRGDALAV